MSIAYNTSIVRDGLVLHLDAANKKSYPGTGTTWFDLSGNGNNGTLINGASFNQNKIVLDGINDYVNVSNAQSLNPGSNSFTIESWVYQKSISVYNGIVEARGTNLNGFLFLINYPSSGAIVMFVNTTNDANQNIYSSTVSTFNDLLTWMHVTVVVNRILETIEFYKNGVKQGNTISITSGGTTDPGSGYVYWVGADKGGAEANIDISVIRHYNRILSLSEIQQNFNALRGRYGI